MIHYLAEGGLVRNGVNYRFTHWDWEIIVRLRHRILYVRHRNKAHPGRQNGARAWIVDWDKKTND